MTDKYQLATFGSGCFWCTEAVFKRIDGVVKVKSGYSGGHVKNPSYREVCEGTTGHAEVVQITYDPEKVSYEGLLEVFFKSHDPTTLNRQGNDVGTQYRSAIFYHSDDQKTVAESVKSQLDREAVFGDPIVTEVTPYDAFYPAEDYHDDYFAQNGSQPYCAFVVKPKVDKVEKVFADWLKSEYR